MKSLVTFSVEKAITIFMAIIAVSIFGFVSFTRLTTDLFPSINIPFAVVVTPFPGATPEQVEAQVTIPLETVFQTTTSVQRVTTTSSENLSLIVIEFSQDTSMDSAVAELRESLNAITGSLPDGVGFPNIIRLNPNQLPIYIMSISIEGLDLPELTEWVENVMRPQVERIPGVATFDISGGFTEEIRIRLDQSALDDYNAALASVFENLPGDAPVIDASYVRQIIQAQNLGFPAGIVQIDGLSYIVRVGDAFASIEELEDLILFNLPLPGSPVPPLKLSDIASVNFESANDTQYSKVNGVDAITIRVQKGSEKAITDVTNEIDAVLLELQNEFDALTITTLLNQGDIIEASTSGVLMNLILGGILAVVVLLVFLRNIRVTFVVGVAIPVSLLFAIILIYLSGITLNVVSLGGLALGIGMLVDNSIVVIENIFRLKKEGASNKEAAIEGTSQVAGAITASTLTTVGVFAPIIFIEDFVREIFLQLALTIAFSLIASLLIAITFVPAIANKIIRVEKSDEPDRVTKVQKVYGSILAGFFKFKFLVLTGVVGLFLLSIVGSVSNGFEFFPSTDEGTLSASIRVPENVPYNFEEFTNDLDQIYTALSTLENIESVGITLGGGGFGFIGGGGQGSANINIVLSADRTQTTLEMRDEVAALLTTFSQYENTVTGTESNAGFLIGSGIEVLIQGPNLEQLREVALDIASALEDVEGLRDIDSGLGRVSQEIKVTVDKDLAIANQLTVAQVLGLVRNRLSTPETTTQLLIGGDRYAVRIFNENDTPLATEDSVESFETLVVGMNAQGQPVFLKDIATIEVVGGFSSITRIDGARSVTVTAEVESEFNASLLASDVEAILNDYQAPLGFSLQIQGETEQTAAAIQNLLLVAALGIVIVYMIMASQFQSLVYPFIIMITIPLAFTGGLGILYVFGIPVSVIAVLGLIILAGIIVNNGIVLVDYINQLRDQGLELKEAIIKAGQTRLRPIFMTALTTILALTGLAIGLGDGTELTQPLALTAIGGLIYGTFLTIFVVPIMYDVVTRKGKMILGGLVILVGLGAGAFLWQSDEMLWAALSLGSTVVIGLAILFIKRPAIKTEPAPQKKTKPVKPVKLKTESFEEVVKKAGDIR
jgi:HAE1 family hydrophobic/amphiphilic exporter-1